MELQLEQQNIPCLIPLAHRTVEEHFSIDAVVPDSMPDAVQLLFTEGDLCLWRLDLADGSAELEGEIDARVCCLDERNSLISIPVRVPMLLRLRAESMETGQKPFLQCRIRNLAGQLLNSRKVRVQAQVQCTLTTYGSSDADVTTGIVSEDHKLFVRKSEAALPYISSVEERVITAEDMLSLRSGIPNDGRLISYSSEPIADTCECGDHRVILKGRIRTSLLYQDAADQNLITETIETPFSGLLDVGGEVKRCRLALHLTSDEVRCRNDEPAVETSFHLLIQVICYSEQRTEYVTDAYSNQAELKMDWADQTFPVYSNQDPVQSILEDTIPCDLTGQTVRAVLADSRGESAAVSVLLQDGNQKYSALSCALQSDHEVIITEPPSVQPGVDGLIVRVPIMQRKASESSIIVHTLRSAETGETLRTNLPGITLVRREETMDLWNLAKENQSSVDAIQAANPERDQASKWVVIPRVI